MKKSDMRTGCLSAIFSWRHPGLVPEAPYKMSLVGIAGIICEVGARRIGVEVPQRPLKPHEGGKSFWPNTYLLVKETL